MPTSRFSFAVVGLGLGAEHARRILSRPLEWELAAVCEPLGDRRAAFTRAHPEVRAFASLDALLEASTPDGVVLAVPHHLHAPMAVQALRAGAHVLVEKPMARTTEECLRMNEAARQTGRTLMVAQNWRYTPWVRVAKAILDRGDLGAIRVVRTEWLQNITADTSRPGNWLLDGERAGGGPVISLVVHNLDALRYLLGEPVEVHAFCLHDEALFRNGAESWGIAQFRFQNGAVGQMMSSYAACPALDEGGRLSIHGERGTLSANGGLPAANLLRVYTAATGAWETPRLDSVPGLPTSDPMLNEISHFVDCARSGAPSLSGGEDNIRTIRFVQTIYESSRRGVALPITAGP
ncbi:MAG TPA: Gfo/Idh/MocA family oxidoreductase [Spirochaetia bacterium]|nr:Gfo/Idh/MocA family oxidoreductase [Spirochaetia bacterium]